MNNNYLNATAGIVTVAVIFHRYIIGISIQHAGKAVGAVFCFAGQRASGMRVVACAHVLHLMLDTGWQEGKYVIKIVHHQEINNGKTAVRLCNN